MAMKKDIEFPSGVVATYHRIVRANVDYMTLPGKAVLHVEVGCYLNEQARRDGKQPIMFETVRMDIEGGEPTREAVYSILSQPSRMITAQQHTGYDPQTGQPRYQEVVMPDPATFTKFNDAELA